MKNVLYAGEIASAGLFIQNHDYDIDLKWFIQELIDNECALTLSEKYDLCCDWLDRYYPDSPHSLALGLVLYTEN